jgi:hypothetical protein
LDDFYVQNLQVANTTSSTVKLTWQSPANNSYDSLRLDYYLVDTATNWTVPLAKTATSYTISGLVAGTSVLFTMSTMYTASGVLVTTPQYTALSSKTLISFQQLYLFGNLV